MEKIISKAEYKALLDSIPREQRMTSYKYANKGETALFYNGVHYVMGE